LQFSWSTSVRFLMNKEHEYTIWGNTKTEYLISADCSVWIFPDLTWTLGLSQIQVSQMSVKWEGGMNCLKLNEVKRYKVSEEFTRTAFCSIYINIARPLIQLCVEVFVFSKL